MSARTQLLALPAAARTAPPPAAVMAKQRGSPGNHIQASGDKYEHQADEAAARILRGEKHVARSLSPAPAASLRIPTSRGEGLPQRLRKELELGFGADLSAVRIHRDAPAHAAARSERARAFASGCNLYFDSSQYDPEGATGRRLLLHEIAHALQQTGRVTGEGRLRVTDAVGTGSIQREEDKFVEYANKFKLFSSPLTWDKIKKAYASIPDFAAHAAILDPLIQPTLPMSPKEIADLAAPTAAAGFKALPDQIKGLYVDALKSAGGDAAAARVLIANPSVPTSFRSRSLYEAVRKRSLDWISSVAAADSFAKDYYPNRFVAVYNIFFLSPGVAPLDLDPGGGKAGAKSFKTKILAELGDLKAAKGLVDNELRATMLLALYYLDEGRPAKLSGDLKALRGENESLVEAHRDLSMAYAKGTADNLSPSSLKESTALFAAVLESIQKAATKAAKFWNRSLAFQLARRAKKGFEDLTDVEVKSIADGIKTDTRFKGLPDLLLATGTKLFARPKGNLLNAGTFAARIAQSKAAVRAEMARYLSRVAELVRADKDREPEGLRLGLALAYLAKVELVLARYDLGRDSDFAKKGRADERIASRVRLADELLDIAIVFGWDALRNAANGVFNEGLQIALLSDWKQDLTADFGALSKEAGGELSGEEGTRISGALLDRYAYIKYFDILTDELTTLLGQRGTDFSDTPTPILTEAMKKAKDKVKDQRPRRFIVQNWEVGDPALARVKGGSSYIVQSFGDAVFKHVLTIQLQKREEKATDLLLAPAELYSPASGPLFLWFVPRFDEFIKLIAGLEVVKKAVEAYWKAKPGNARALPDPEKQPLAWLDVLGDLATELGAGDENAKATLQTIGKAISGAVETAFAKSQKAAYDKARRAVSHERRVLVEKHFRPDLASYDRNDLRTWDVPGVVFQNIATFAGFVYPAEDQVLQLSALVLEIAEELMAAFGPKTGVLGTSHIRRFDIIDTVLTLAFETVRAWEGGQPDPSKVKAGVAPPQNSIAAISWLSKAELEARAVTLRKLRDSLAERAEAEQKLDGLRGHKDSKTLSSVYWDTEGTRLIKWNMRYTSVGPGITFDLHGNEYVIIEVFETFTFHPGFGKRETLGVTWPSGAQRPGSPKLLDQAGVETKPTGRKLFTVLYKPQFGDPRTIEVTDQNTEGLAWFSMVLGEHLGFEYLLGAGVFIEKYANLVMDVLEFLPGVGKGLATARFVASILETISNPEFKDVLDAFSKDGIGAFEKIFESLAKVVQFEELANVLIFDEDFQEKTRNHPSLRGKQDRRQKVAGKGGAWTRIAILLKNVIEIGVRVLDRIKRLVHRVQTPVRDAQLWVLRHPVAVLMLDVIERAFDVLSSLSIADLAQAAEDLVDKGWEKMMKDAVTKAAQNVADRGRDTLDTLRHLELPEEVIPMEWIIDFIIDLAVRALSAKYRKGVQAVRGILRTLGLWDKVLSAIKDGLFEAGVDPNELYRSKVRDKLQPWLADVRDTFAAELTAVLQEVPFLAAISQPKGTPITLDFSGLGFEGYLAPRRAPSGAPSLVGSLPAEGPRLPQAQRLRSEAALGHDLGHVRLHRGDDGDRLTQAFGAEAITTGSHVFVRSGLNLGEAQGQRVLHHELAHVVQQTGPRPLGGTFSDGPSAGGPARGLYWDPAREAAADRAAEAAGSGRIARQPLALGGRSHGVQPSFTKEFLRKFLRRLHKDADIVESREEVEKARKKVTLDTESQAVATALGPALKPWLGKKATFEAPFASVQPQLKTFADAVWADFEKGIPLLVSRAITTVSPPKKSGEEEGTVAYLPPENLKVQIERELYGLTSMAFVVELRGKKGPKKVKEREIVDKDKPVKSVRMVYVHLPLLKESEASEKLWDLLVENTFRSATDYSKTTHDSYEAATKLVLGRGSPSPDTYDTSQFKLSKRRATVVRNQRERLVEFVKGKDWPAPDEYAITDAKSVRAAVADVGLRLGTYSTWGPDSKSVTDRDAHHIVQFLLFEYFRNAKSRKPFPLKGQESYPGVEPAGGGEVSAITSSQGRISVDKYFQDHGGAVPTIFLARHTHQSGIHYHTEPPDDGSGKRSTQGATLDNTFKSALGHYESVMKDRPTLAQLAKNKKQGQDDEPVGSSTPPVTVSRVSNAIFRATQAAYKDMWGEMKPKLKTALDVQEMSYYNAIAKLRGMPEMQKSKMTKVFQTVTKESEMEIGTTAGFGPGFRP